MTNLLKQTIFYLALAALITLFLINTNTYFPFIITKATVFRVIVEVMLVCWVGYLIKSQKTKDIFRHPLILAVVVFGLIIFLSAVLGINFKWSFFSGNERMEGVFGIWHFMVFFVILATTFTKEEMENLLKYQIYISLFYAFVALLAYQGLGQVTAALTSNRLAGYTGNPSYYAAYALFNAFLALYFAFEEYSKKHQLLNWWLIIFLGESLLMVLTGCRGAFLAWLGTLFLITIFIFWKSPEQQLKKILGILILVVLVGWGSLFALRNTAFIKHSFALERLTSFSFHDPTTVSRLLSAQSAFKAFLERPFFGWGVENYQTAYIKYFNPTVIKYLPGDFFFDRAHNKPLEVLATTGIFGFLSYLAIFVIALKIIFQKQKQEPTWFLSGLALAGALVSYFLQNVFIFDFHESYLMFYLTLAFIATLVPKPAAKEVSVSKKAAVSDFAPELLKSLIFCATLCLALYSLTFWVISPYLVSKNIINVMKLAANGKGEEAYQLAQEIFRQPTFLRQDAVVGLDKFVNMYQDKLDEASLQKLVTLLLTNADLSFQETPNYLILLSKADLEMIASRWDETALTKAEDIFKQAIELAPNFPQPRLSYARLLINNKNYEEAKQQLEFVISLNDKLPEPYYFLSAIAQTQGDLEKSREFLIKSLELGLQLNDKNTILIIANELASLKRYDLIEKLYLQAIQLDPKDAKLYVYLAADYGKLHNKEKAIEYALKAQQLDPSLKEASQEFIQLIQNEEWDKIPE